MCQYAWPGNVRELENVVQRALILSRDRVIELRHLPADMSADPAVPSSAIAMPQVPGDQALASMSLELGPATEALEDRLIAEALRRTDDNKRRAALLLGISERTLWYKLGRARH
jgi:two-component system response regulator AtoC